MRTLRMTLPTTLPTSRPARLPTTSQTKRALAACAAAAAFAAALPCAAQPADYPARPVTAIVAFPPGAPNDFIVRLVGEPFAQAMKQALVAENRPGAGGNLAAEAVAKAGTDGYTLLATIDTVVTVNPTLYKKLSFRADTQLTPVIYLANTAQTLVCHPSVPVKTVADLVAHAKVHELNFASGGYGTPGHLAAELFIAATGTKIKHIPYKGPGPATQDLLGGIVSCGFLATPVVMPHVKGGKLQALGVTASKRSPLAPELPTLAEAGIQGYEAAFGELLLAPKGTPEAVVARLNETLARILQQPDVRARMAAVDLEFIPNTPAQAAARLKTEAEKWTRVVDRLGLQVD